MKKKKFILLITVLVILVFSDVLAQVFSPFSYFDEVLAVVSTIIIAINIKKHENIRFIVMILIIIFVGMLSNVYSGLKTNSFAMLVDAFTTFKAFIIYIGFSNIISDETESNKTMKALALIAKIYAITALLFLILNYLSLVDMTERIRYGLKEFKFIFINAGSFGYFSMVFLPFLEKNKKDYLFILIILVLIMSTLKGPQLIFVFLYVYCKLMQKIKKNRKIINILLLPIVILGILYISKYQISNYLLNNNSARYKLTEKAIITANDYFPLGSGFATYGSEMSRRYYSPLYYKYGFNKIYGLGGATTSYINDNYWQMIIAQLGYFGFALNVVFMTIFCKYILDKMKNSKYYTWMKCMLICVLIGSIGSAYITGCVFSALMFAVCLLNGDVKYAKKEY